MKLSPSTWMSEYRSKGMQTSNLNFGVQTPPPIPYERCERSKDKDNENVSVFKLRTNPNNDDSPTYDMKALTFTSGSVEEYIMWKRDLRKICVGQHVTDPAGKFAMTRRLLDGDALAAFNRAAESFGNETNMNYNNSMNELAKHVFPMHALVLQRQWFHRFMKKPGKHQMRQYVARVNEINYMMVEFPPLFNITQTFDEDEMKDLLEFSIPWQWRIEMVQQGFRPIEHTIPEIIEFCERQEVAESVIAAVNNANSRAGQKGNGNGKFSKLSKHKEAAQSSSWKGQGNAARSNKHKRNGKCVSFNESNGRDGCRLHPDAVSHTTAECTTVQKQIDTMRGTYAAKTGGYGAKRQKTQPDADSSRRTPGGDLHTLLDDLKHIRERVEKEIKQRGQESGKRKREDNVHEEKQETPQSAAAENVSDNFDGELEQLTLSDVPESELEDLEPLSEEEFEA
jgi:hypothetical protein